MLSDLKNSVLACYQNEFDFVNSATSALAKLGVMVDSDSVTKGHLIDAYWRVVETVEREGARLEKAGNELHYHNRRHVASTLVALSSYLAINPVFTLDEQLLAMIAMAGHDYGHQGKSNWESGEIQEELTAKWICKSCLSDLTSLQQNTVSDFIIGTQLSKVDANHKVFSDNPKDTKLHLQVLINEADITASLIPELSKQLTKSLLLELEVESNDAFIDAFYSSFLEKIQISSVSAQEILLPIIDKQNVRQK
jgi:hypothetical protein